jgi:hypothetical protein
VALGYKEKGVSSGKMAPMAKCHSIYRKVLFEFHLAGILPFLDTILYT